MNKRKPFIVEFTGTPEAGKTTVINLLYNNLKRLGYKVKLYPESAEITPTTFPKGCLEENLWRNFDTAKNILEAQYLSDYDIVLFDRGSFDRIFWIYLDAIYNTDIASKNVPFIEIFTQYPPNFLIAFYVSEEESIMRRGGEGRLVTKKFVSNYNHLFKTFVNSLEINKYFINTENKTIEEVTNITEYYVLENFKNHN